MLDLNQNQSFKISDLMSSFGDPQPANFMEYVIEPPVNIFMEQMSDSADEAFKFILCVFRCQYGKTFTAISKINAEIGRDSELGRSIHMVYAMNTILNNSQFASRLKSIEETYGRGSVVVFSSRYEGPYMHIKTRQGLQGLCFDESTCPRIVVMCSNDKRYDDGFEFVNVINRNKTTIARLHLYYDELHKYINEGLRVQIETMHSFKIVAGIMALTATPKNIWKTSGFWSKLRMIDLRDINDENYTGCNDINFSCVDDYFRIPYLRPKSMGYDQLDRQTLGFMNHVIDKNPDIISDGNRLFIPAHIRRSGHNEVRKRIFELNDRAVVIMINGFEKSIQYKNGITITKPLISSGEEVCETIADIIIKNGLQTRPIIITGFLCVSMGQTLMSKRLGTFTHSIIGYPELSNDDLYQIAGRNFGRTKHWETYVETTIFCPTLIMTRIIAMEECAKNMTIEHFGQLVTVDDYQRPMVEMGETGRSALENIHVKAEKVVRQKADETDKDHKIFNNQDEAKDWVKRNLGRRLNKRNGEAPKELRDMNGGNNPKLDQILKRMWGINDKNKVRMCITDQKQWVVYWRPSMFPETATPGGASA